ncbi:MAG TPA: hypothetical protein VH044_11950 [Polyangiaceae bacterium]|jgi:hypothetical protein|nr:hypothetical protein [Polyangiaceae bacterium]
MNGWLNAAPWIAIGLIVTNGCSSAAGGGGLADSPGAFPSDNAGSGSGDSSGSSSGSSSSGSSGGQIALPPEMKAENQFKAPVATGNFVWSANPTSGRVAYINASTFDVKTTPAGNGPTYLAAVVDKSHPQDDVAIVINVLSQDATLLRVDATGNLSTQTYPSTIDANSWAISPSGHWGIAWTDATFVSNPDPTQSFQNLAVMDLTATVPSPVVPAPSTVLAVGYRPVEIAFSADDSRAYAVTEDGISVIQLQGGAPVVIRQDPLSATPATTLVDAGDGGAPDAGNVPARDDAGDDSGATASGTPDVSFTPDGAYALVRRDGLPWITVDRLSDGALGTVPLPSTPTDLTISPLGDFALAVLRDTSTAIVLPIPGVFTDPTAVTAIPVPGGHTLGRGLVTNGGKSAVLFTTVVPDESITVLTLQPTINVRTIPLHAPVQAVFPTSDGQNAIVLHQLLAAANSTARGAFSVVPIGQSLPAVIESLPAPPTAVALSNDRAIVSIRDDTTSTFGLYLALMPSLEVKPLPLASPPIAVGIAQGAGRGYAAQDYSEGRITFVDLAEGSTADAGGNFTARTITGFELSAGIVVGPDR